MTDKKLPSIWQMTKNFSRDVAKYIAEGAPNVSPKDYTQRLATCNSCEFLIRDSMRCSACGCLLEHKAKWRTTKCPKDKWKNQYGENEEGGDSQSSD